MLAFDPQSRIYFTSRTLGIVGIELEPSFAGEIGLDEISELTIFPFGRGFHAPGLVSALLLHSLAGDVALEVFGVKHP